MSELQIPIFPFESGAITLTTAVWIGVCVTVFFNLRLGWTLSGLVVPGYLAPLLITRPVTGAVILFEAILTYWVVQLISCACSRKPYWSNFFGRDRFFLIVIVSVLVRALFDGWLLPLAGQFVVEQFDVSFNYRENLRSFGLIVVALIANYFWKPGLRRGLVPVLTTSLITFLIIKFVLVEFTNFNIGNLHVLYEDISTSLMASPKAYMIVITTAFIASWINLRYAWDFNGILIPALLGLLWYDPSKILISCCECAFIYAIAFYLLKLPVFKSMTIEGGSKLLFFFSICFCYRLILCHLLPLIAPGIELGEALGFGYLLTTLMAIKAYDKKLVARMLTATAKVSMLGAVAGSLIGFAFVCGPRIALFASPPLKQQEMAYRQLSSSYKNVFDLIRQDKLLIYRQRLPDSYKSPLPRELTLLQNALERVEQMRKFDRREFAELQQLFRLVNYELHFLDDRYFYLREASDVQGWGIYLIDIQREDGLCVQIPAPLDEGATLEAGIRLFQKFPSQSLAIAGAPRNSGIVGEADVLRTPNTMFGVFHRVFSKGRTVMVRGYTQGLKRKLKSLGLNHQQSQVWIRDNIPAEFELARLKDIIGDYHVRWNSSPTRNQLRDSTPGPFVELFLNVTDMRQLIGHQISDESKASGLTTSLSIRDLHISQWVQEQKDIIIKPGTDGYAPAAIEELLYLDEEVVAPLIRLIDNVNQHPETEDQFLAHEPYWLQLRGIHAAAKVMGYGVQVIRDRQTSHIYIALSESNDSETKGWGTFVFKLGTASPYAIEVPRPLYEFRSYDFGHNLFIRTDASALLIAGAHPRANRNGSADISKADNRTNLYNLVRHILFRERGDQPFLIAQARAIQAPVDADVVVATDEGKRSAEGLSFLKQELLQKLKNDDLRIAFVDGSEKTAGYEIGILLQATMVQISANKEVISLWLSPSLRSKFREQTETDNLSAQFLACGLSTIDDSLWQHLIDLANRTQRDNPKRSAFKRTAIPLKLRSDLVQYAYNNDIVKLLSIIEQFPDWHFSRVVDSTSGQGFLLIQHRDDSFPSIMNLTGFLGESVQSCQQLSKREVESYVRSRTLWLEVDSP